ncbi:hypothetical protein AT727_02670 [Desulfitobacterium hafniense]|uniref:Uncharacterized protein n=1 Tax=Desulfitobacterium hafniense TaxID=49338 RepID=A0A0W1JQM8_DESHA|nr:hypothetical protein [Desulfitobacterium hafniense]KTE93877.1 hypothetical protein AT727_02670 [Desulfitobacterium hafniense]
MMKNKIFKIIGIIVLIIAIVGFWGYSKYLKPNPVIQQQLVEQFGEDFFSFEDVELAGDVGSGDSEGKVTSPPQKNNSEGTNVDTEAGIVKENVENKNSAPSKEENTEPVTLEQIDNKYQPQFSHLQNLAVSRLDTLFATAIQEYKEGTLSRSQLSQKYIQAASTLEASVDSQFYAVLAKMKKELKENNLATDIINVYRVNYENAKSDKRAQLFAQVR